MRVLVAGDSHGFHDHLDYLYERAAAMDCQAIFSVGDTGYWPRDPNGLSFLLQIERLGVETGIQFYWLDGNHEDHDNLDHVVKGVRDSFVKISNHNFYSPRGHTWEWDGVRFLTVGGAYSIDRAGRTLGYDWFEQEDLTDEDVAAAVKAGKVDVLLCHDAPAEVDMVGIYGRNRRRMFEFDHGTIANRERLQRVVNATNPSLVIHGHWHQDYNERSLLSEERVNIGLHCNFQMRRSWTVVDTEDFRGR